MATSYKLVMTFADSNGKEFSLSYPHITEDLEQTSVTALINAIITNGSIFATVPVTCKSAKLVTITDTAFTVPA